MLDLMGFVSESLSVGAVCVFGRGVHSTFFWFALVNQGNVPAQALCTQNSIPQFSKSQILTSRQPKDLAPQHAHTVHERPVISSNTAQGRVQNIWGSLWHQVRPQGAKHSNP